jgi:hypothetical protein
VGNYEKKVVERKLKYKYTLNLAVMRLHSVSLGKIAEQLWEIICYPLIIALLAFFYFGLVYVLMIAGLGLALVYSALWFAPVVAVLIRREREEIKCLLRQ